MKITVTNVPRPPTYVSFNELEVGSTFVPQWNTDQYRIKVSETYYYDFIRKQANLCCDPELESYQRINSELTFFIKGE